MKIFKIFAVLLLALTFNSAYCSTNDPAKVGELVTPPEPSFFSRMFSFGESKEEIVEPTPWDKKLVYDVESLPKQEEEPSWVEDAARAVGLYFANVGSDLLDIVSLEVSFGNTFALDVHATNQIAFCLENSDAYFAGFGPLHRIGAGRREVQRAAFLCWSYDDIYQSQIAGKMPSFSYEDASFNLVRYYSDIYTDRNVDYLAIGGKVAMFAGIAVDLHIAAIPDFFCSLVACDLYGDNWK